MSKRISISDNPVTTSEQDALKLDKQVKGFAEYLRNCDAPLTISLEGAWGSGKTSFFELVRSYIEKQQTEELESVKQEKDATELADTCKFVSFNTWQYSHFSSDYGLPATFIEYIVQQIGADDEETKKSCENVLNVLKIVGATLAYAGNEYVKGASGGKLDVIAAIDKTKIKESKGKDVFFDAIAALKKSFTECVEKSLKAKEGKGQKRLIIFVDELDRLIPEKAIELLETMKLFMNTPNCLFVLAIDYEVVEKGVLAKYKNALDEEKAKDYFEKMIQVVYRMPSTMTNMSGYIFGLLDGEDMDRVTSYNCAMQFADLLKAAHKDNPRAVKRLINNYLLIRTIGKSSGLLTDADIDEEVCLFAFVCMQSVLPDVYDVFCLRTDHAIGLLMQDLNNLSTYGDFEAFEPKYGGFCEVPSMYYGFLNKMSVVLNRVTDPQNDMYGRIRKILRVMSYSEEDAVQVSEILVILSDDYLDYCNNELSEDVMNVQSMQTSSGSFSEAFHASVALLLGIYKEECQRLQDGCAPGFCGKLLDSVLEEYPENADEVRVILTDLMRQMVYGDGKSMFQKLRWYQQVGQKGLTAEFVVVEEN